MLCRTEINLDEEEKKKTIGHVSLCLSYVNLKGLPLFYFFYGKIPFFKQKMTVVIYLPDILRIG